MLLHVQIYWEVLKVPTDKSIVEFSFLMMIFFFLIWWQFAGKWFIYPQHKIVIELKSNLLCVDSISDSNQFPN